VRVRSRIRRCNTLATLGVTGAVIRWALTLGLVVSPLILFGLSGGRAVPDVHAADQPTLSVFLPADVKSGVIEKALQAHLPGLRVVVFGRFRDFELELTAHRPDAVLALEPLLVAQHIPPVLRGLSEGRDSEKYVLLSAGAPLAGSLSGKTIGVVDFLGRNDTQTFMAAALKTPDVRTKLVTKQEDLLSLLQFSAADAVLIPTTAVKSFAERSRLVFHVREVPGLLVGRAAVGVLRADARAAVVRAIEGLDGVTNRMLGVDAWRAR
jgi:hypothetical protein